MRVTRLVLQKRVQATNLMAYAVLPGVGIGQALGLPVRRLRLLLADLTALGVVSATAAVGLALVMALICVPSLASLAGAPDVRSALGRAALLGLVGQARSR
ncbi:MAG: metal ABC transporter permease [Cyanobacteriota bacterium]